jgi:hypothetical protein
MILQFDVKLPMVLDLNATKKQNLPFLGINLASSVIVTLTSKYTNDVEW